MGESEELPGDTKARRPWILPGKRKSQSLRLKAMMAMMAMWRRSGKRRREGEGEGSHGESE